MFANPMTRNSAMDAMSAQDSSFLFAENEFNPMHIALVAVFKGPRPSNHEIEEMVSSKLDQVPRYRQKVRSMPLDLGQPVWVDDERFDLSYHVRHTAVPAPGGKEQLSALVGRVVSQRLDRTRPLWEMWVVEGLEGDEWALLSKTHHCLVDGVAGSDLMSVLLDTSPDVVHSPGSDWKPRRGPRAVDLMAHSLAGVVRGPRESLRAIGRLSRTPREALTALGEFTEGLASFRELGSSPLEVCLNGRIGPHRRWLSTSTGLADIQKIRACHGGTVNDVVLAAIAVGFRALLLARKQPVSEMSVRSLVPVSVRRDDERGDVNNRIAAVLIDLPVDIADPIKCLAVLRSETDRAKTNHQIDAAETLGALTIYSPPALLAAGARLFSDFEQHAIQTVTTNVRGPHVPLFAAGRRMLAAYPFVPIFGSVRIGVAIFSYDGMISFGVTGDYEGAPDIDVLTDGIDQALSRMLKVS